MKTLCSLILFSILLTACRKDDPVNAHNHDTTSGGTNSTFLNEKFFCFIDGQVFNSTFISSVQYTSVVPKIGISANDDLYTITFNFPDSITPGQYDVNSGGISTALFHDTHDMPVDSGYFSISTFDKINEHVTGTFHLYSHSQNGSAIVYSNGEFAVKYGE